MNFHVDLVSGGYAGNRAFLPDLTLKALQLRPQ